MDEPKSPFELFGCEVGRGWIPIVRKAIKELKEEGCQIFQVKHKSSLQCKYGDEDDYACLDFHHRDPTKKEITISKAIDAGWSRERILKELEKCDVVCANCHRKIHKPL